jgi:hypothetical protein
MPDGENCSTGYVWGPGIPQAPYKGRTVTITTTAPDPPDACESGAKTTVAGPHPIHIGS